MQTLEAALNDIAEKHDLTSISVGRMPCGSRLYFTATVHWSGFSSDGNPCESKMSEASVAHALSLTLEAAKAKRAAPIEFPALMVEAA